MLFLQRLFPQGISALVSFDPTGDADSNKDNMMEAIDCVLSGQVTYAVRDTQIDGHDVKKGDYIAINDEGLVASETDIKDSVIKMLDGMVSEAKIMSLSVSTMVLMLTRLMQKQLQPSLKRNIHILT